jgi:hypothetical protein
MARYKSSGIEVGDVQATIEVEGPEDDAEKVKMHAHDELVKAMQAVDEQEHPDDCDGLMFGVNWDKVLEDD